ncbi:unnamed protein product [Onchocerca flexuosa]|uniref:ATP synthase subunit b n=1 Tax=Onchocerca flexuosa TaxID=387005 RepID=A0A183I624_9BILA|nr:unnamed protein product [Onchocerca flexuosa]
MALNRYALATGTRTQACILQKCSQPIYTGKFDYLSNHFMVLLGIPLKDELHAPISFMRDIGKQYIPPPLPEVPKDFKEYPERDLVNYPFPVKRMYPPKLRLMIIPDKFMSNFHKYTGTSDRWDKYFYENCKKAEKKYLDIIDNNFKTIREVQEVRYFMINLVPAKLKKYW